MVLVPLIVFLILATGLSFVARQRSKKHGSQGFLSEYFIGGRSLGPFVLAMTCIATYGSVSSFVGGPGAAFSIGFGWVYMASVQVTALLLLYGIVGKRMALVGRKLSAVTVGDVLSKRFDSALLGYLCASIIVVFFLASMVAQFVGGAKLFSSVTELPYELGLLLFGLCAILFTVIGGFRGVALTDAFCGIVMLVGIVVLGGGILQAAGGYEQALLTLQERHPQFLEPFSAGKMPLELYLSQWMLVGIFTLALPQSVVRCLGYKDTQSLHRALIIGTVILGAMMIGVTSLGVFAAALDPVQYGLESAGVDSVIPQVIAHALPTWLIGIAIIGPIAASISTVSSLLIASSSALLKDVYAALAQKRGKQVSNRFYQISSQAVTLLFGLLVFVLALTPPDLIWKINMFAFGGLESSFCWVLLAGLFWKRATRAGALASVLGGLTVYIFATLAGLKVLGLHQIALALFCSLFLMVVGSLLTRPSKKECDVQAVFFPHHMDSDDALAQIASPSSQTKSAHFQVSHRQAALGLTPALEEIQEEALQ